MIWGHLPHDLRTYYMSLEEKEKTILKNFLLNNIESGLLENRQIVL
jgi:hypothetical protein